MAQDCRDSGARAEYIPHHARLAQRRNPIRPEVQTLGYEGGEQYIRHWRPIIEAECQRRGWSFVVNPPQLADIDIVLALRDHSGYPARAWKSNVKLANAQATGTPIVCSPESGYLETDRGGVAYATDRRSLSEALDSLAPHAARRAWGDVLYGTGPTLEQCAQRYRQWLSHLRS